jgi:cytochrome c peroxidase
MNFRLFLILLACGWALGAADGPCKPDVAALKHKYVRPTAVPFPVENAFNKDREILGRMLFFDPRLSAMGTVSCASCHNPAFGWDDGLPHSASRPTARRTPSIVNVAWGQRFFWDGRAASLEEQALGPIQNENEMNLPLEKMVAVVRGIEGYQALFARAYPREPVSEKTVAKALATFERTIVSAQAPFDRWVAGDGQAISASAQRGFVLFNGKAACAPCHAGWEFTDHDFHDIGTVDLDPGRGKYLPAENMQHAFKTPGLRNVATRTAYMHDGSQRTLEAVIEYYDGGGMCLRPSLSPRIHNLQLSGGEKRDLLDFLLTLTSDDAKVEIPNLPRR